MQFKSKVVVYIMISNERIEVMVTYLVTLNTHKIYEFNLFIWLYDYYITYCLY